MRLENRHGVVTDRPLADLEVVLSARDRFNRELLSGGQTTGADIPRALELRHFGITTWRRVVYLNNASLLDIRGFHFCDGDAGVEEGRIAYANVR